MASSTAIVTVPSCSAHVSAGAYNSADAAGFDLRSHSYYKHLLLTGLPGFIFGVLCWVATIFFIVYLLTLCCRRIYWRNWRYTGGVKDADGNRIQNRRGSTIPVMLLTIVCALGVCGVGAWGIVQGLHETKGSVAEFFGVIDSFQVTLANVTTQATDLTSDAAIVGTSLTSAHTAVTTSPTLMALLTAGGYSPTELGNDIQSASNSLTSGIASAQTAINGIGGVQSTFVSIQSYQGTANNVSHTYRPLALGLLFGLIMLFSLIVMITTCIGRVPRLNAFFLVLLGVITGFILLIGAGGMDAVLTLSKDSCLYAETYIQRLTSQGNSSPTKEAEIQAGLQYYSGRTNYSPAEAFEYIFGVNLAGLTNFSSEGQVETFLDDLRNPRSTLVVEIQADPSISSTDKANILALPSRIDTTTAQIPNLEDSASSAVVTPLYIRTKQLICCTLANTVWQVWLALTICGALAGAVCILAAAATFMAVGQTNNAEMESQEYVRYPLAQHPRGAPKGALLRPENNNGSGPYTP